MKIIEPRRTGRVRVATFNQEPSRVQEQFKEATDVNNIMKKYKKIGIGYNQLPHSTNGVYGDFSKTQDYHSALNQVLNAQTAFMALPSDLRARFSNDPAHLLSFLSDKNNYDEGVKLGLLNPKPIIKTEPSKNDDLNDEKPVPKPKSKNSNPEPE